MINTMDDVNEGSSSQTMLQNPYSKFTNPQQFGQAFFTGVNKIFHSYQFMDKFYIVKK